MKIDGTRSFAAPRATVWQVLNDPAQMAKLMPGVESFDVEDDRHWTANVKIPLGIGGLKMRIAFEKLEERELEFARLSAKGQGVGAIMNMQTRFELSEEPSGTAMRWEADVRIAGPVGSMGQRVLQPIVNQQVTNVLNALDEQVMAAGETGGSDVYLGAEPGAAPGVVEPGRVGAAAGDTGASGGADTGSAGAQRASTDVPVHTDPELRDAGPPARTSPDADAAAAEGSSGAREGINPLSPEAYDGEPEGPTISIEDRP